MAPTSFGCVPRSIAEIRGRCGIESPDRVEGHVSNLLRRIAQAVASRVSPLSVVIGRAERIFGGLWFLGIGMQLCRIALTRAEVRCAGIPGKGRCQCCGSAVDRGNDGHARHAVYHAYVGTHDNAATGPDGLCGSHICASKCTGGRRRPEWVLSCWIAEFEGVVVDVGVAVVGLGELGVVVASAVVVQARVLVERLAGVAAGHLESVSVVLVVLLAKRRVAIVLDDFARAVGHQLGRAQVVRMVVVEHRIVGGRTRCALTDRRYEFVKEQVVVWLSHPQSGRQCPEAHRLRFPSRVSLASLPQ